MYTPGLRAGVRVDLVIASLPKASEAISGFWQAVPEIKGLPIHQKTMSNVET